MCVVLQDLTQNEKKKGELFIFALYATFDHWYRCFVQLVEYIMKALHVLFHLIQEFATL